MDRDQHGWGKDVGGGGEEMNCNPVWMLLSDEFSADDLKGNEELVLG